MLIALRNTRSQKFQLADNSVAANDVTLANSGGISVGVANLSLPGDFAFKTQTFQVTTNGITTSMVQVCNLKIPLCKIEEANLDALGWQRNSEVFHNGNNLFKFFNSSTKLIQR